MVKQIVRRAGSARKGTKKVKTLPQWSLSDLYTSPDDKKISSDLRKAKKQAEAFRRKYAGTLAKVSRSPVRFKNLLAEYEAIMLLASKPYHYASLLFAESALETGRGGLLQMARTRYVEIVNLLAFFHPEVLSISKQRLRQLSSASSLSAYKNYLIQLIRYQKHELPERDKQIFSDMSLSGKDAVMRMFDEEFASRLYELPIGRGKGRQLGLEEILELLHSPDRDLRRRAQKGFSQGLKEDARRLTLCFNTLLQDKQIRDRYHRFRSPEESRHLENQISPQAAESLVRAAKQSYRDVKRFYEFKRQLLGYKELFDYDRYAPLGKTKKIPWKKAQEWVEEAFEEFHPECGRIAREFFDKGWIDAAARPGKRGGAFCSFVTPDLHPYVFLNYGGTERDVFTLAHELGHAIHAYLMREQSYLSFDTPLTIAETASVFAELLLYESLMKKTRDASARLAMSIRHVENIIATVHRQIAMFQFERDIHAAREKGELATETFNALWRVRQQEMFKGAVTLTEEYDYWWSYIPHFIHSPFYVYAYSFGQLLALGLFERYQDSRENFPEKYLDFLKAGNSRSPQQLGRSLGINLSRPEIWQQGVLAFRKRVKAAIDLA